MNSPTPNLSNDQEELAPSTEEVSSSHEPSTTSATTNDHPAFGWSAYAERVNGRFAMIGFVAVLLIEAIHHNSFLHWAGFLY